MRRQRVAYTTRPSRDPSDAALLVGHGTVTSPEEVPQFLRRIRRGREPSAELVAEIRRRYAAIGGSPLLEITQRQANALGQRLGMRVALGMRMSEPSLELGLRTLAEEGARRVVVVPLAPFSVGVYARAARQALETANVPIRVVEVDPWGTEPALIAAWASQIRPFLATDSHRSALVLTAHSLPVSVIAAGDPYVDQFNRCASAVMAALGGSASIAYQSQGDSGGQWMAPTLLEAVRGACHQGADRIVVAPVGFLSDHLETLYDLDVEARAWAEDVGLAFSRVPALNDHPGLIDAMAAIVDRALSTDGRARSTSSG